MIFLRIGITEYSVLTNVSKTQVRQSSVKDIEFQMTDSSTKSSPRSFSCPDLVNHNYIVTLTLVRFFYYKQFTIIYDMGYYQQILSGMKNDQGNHSTSRQEQNLSVFLRQLSQ
jgi:hypothetical protein